MEEGHKKATAQMWNEPKAKEKLELMGLAHVDGQNGSGWFWIMTNSKSS
jgi:hypothetical protein